VQQAHEIVSYIGKGLNVTVKQLLKCDSRKAGIPGTISKERKPQHLLYEHGSLRENDAGGMSSAAKFTR